MGFSVSEPNLSDLRLSATLARARGLYALEREFLNRILLRELEVARQEQAKREAMNDDELLFDILDRYLNRGDYDDALGGWVSVRRDGNTYLVTFETDDLTRTWELR